MRRARNRSFRPETMGLEERQLLSGMAEPMAMHAQMAHPAEVARHAHVARHGHIARHAHPTVPTAPTAPITNPVVSPTPASPVSANADTTSTPTTAATTASPVISDPGSPPTTTFFDTSNAAPALVQFGGKTLLVWTSSTDGTMNVAPVGKGPSGYELGSKVLVGTATSPGLTPAATVFDGRLYVAWTGTDGRLNVISSADGVNFANKVILANTSHVGPALAVFNGRLYLGWTDTNGYLNVASSANGTSFSTKVTLSDMSDLSLGGKDVDLSPALAAFDGRLYIAWTGFHTHLNVASSANGTTFSNPVTLDETSDASPALTVEQPAVKGQPPCLVIGWTGVVNVQLNTMTLTNGQTFGGKVTYPQAGFDGIALLSPTGGTLDIAWIDFDPVGHTLNFMPI